MASPENEILIHPAESESPEHGALLDLATEEGVRAYLAKTPWACSRIVPLSGGFANYVFRVWLKDPDAFRGKETVVVKHAKPYVKTRKTLPFVLERQVRCFLLDIGLCFAGVKLRCCCRTCMECLIVSDTLLSAVAEILPPYPDALR